MSNINTVIVDGQDVNKTTLRAWLNSPDCTGNIEVDGYLKTGAYTVATLPAAGTAGAGARAIVTDANATTFASVVAAGGANTVPVYSNGTAWLIG